MPDIIFNIEYVGTEYYTGNPKAVKKIVNTNEAFSYYDRDDACDKIMGDSKTVFHKNKEIKTMNTWEAFDYYNYRVGSTGGFNEKEKYDQIEASRDVGKYKPEILYRCVFSFDKEFAQDVGLTKAENIRKLIKKSMAQNIKDLGFDPNNVLWAGYYHTNTDNPHIHVWFYEKKQTKRQLKLQKYRFEKVKSRIISNTARNITLYVERDEKKKAVLDVLENAGVTSNMKRLLMLSENNHKGLFSKKVNRQLTKKLKKLENVLPKKGSMKYNSKNIMPYRQQIDEIVDEYMQQPIFEEVLDTYKKMLDKEEEAFRKSYGDKIALTYKEDRMKELHVRFANMILANIKQYRMDEDRADVRNISCHEVYDTMQIRSNMMGHGLSEEIGKCITNSWYACKALEASAAIAVKRAKEENHMNVSG